MKSNRACKRSAHGGKWERSGRHARHAQAFAESLCPVAFPEDKQ